MSAIEYSPAMNSRFGRALVQHPVQSIGLFHIPLNGVRDLLGRVQPEMMVLPCHGAESGHLPEQPLEHVGPPAGARHELPGFLGEIQQDRTRLENRYRRTAVCRVVISQRGNTVVRRYLEKLGRKLLAFGDIDGNDPIGKLRFLEEYRDLVAVWRGPVVRSNIRRVLEISPAHSSQNRHRLRHQAMPFRASGTVNQF